MRILSLVLFTVLLTFCASSAQAQEPCKHHDQGHKICKKEKLAKIFADPEQILVNQDGIFVYTANKNHQYIPSRISGSHYFSQHF